MKPSSKRTPAEVRRIAAAIHESAIRDLGPAFADTTPADLLVMMDLALNQYRDADRSDYAVDYSIRMLEESRRELSAFIARGGKS